MHSISALAHGNAIKVVILLVIPAPRVYDATTKQ